MFTKAITNDLQVYRAANFRLHAQEGFNEVAQLIAQHKVKIDNYKFLILLFGRADLWDNEREYRMAVANCLTKIRRKNEEVIVILNAPLPIPNDTRKNIKTFGLRNNYLALLTDESIKLEFLKPGRALICARGPSMAFYEDNGNLNAAGLQLVKNGIESTFRRGHLRRKFQDQCTGPSQ